jgi:phospho-N-acetylmuramoyl-pentapeptide-transferase
MQAVIVAAVVGFFITLAGTPIAIRSLVSLRAGQPIRDINPEAHQLKRGTPTMGGLVFIFGTLAAYVVGHLVMKQLPSAQIVPPGPTMTGLVLLGLMVCCGAIGFIDDFLKVSRKNTAGLAGRWKLVLQVLVGLGFGTVALLARDSTAGLTVGSDSLSFIRDINGWQIGTIGAIIVIVALVMATTNGVNLTDGLDGLATGTAIVVFFAYVMISFWQYRHWCADPTYVYLHRKHLYCYTARDPLESAMIAAAAAGALAGFLWWNTSPAKIIMGDTGSMALGGLIAGEAVATHTILLLPVIALLFVTVTMSRIIQYGSFKMFHRRVFRMSPLHHHFEMAGWSEVNIVIRFWIIALIGVAIALGLFYSGFLAQS